MPVGSRKEVVPSKIPYVALGGNTYHSSPSYISSPFLQAPAHLRTCSATSVSTLFLFHSPVPACCHYHMFIRISFFNSVHIHSLHRISRHRNLHSQHSNNLSTHPLACTTLWASPCGHKSPPDGPARTSPATNGLEACTSTTPATPSTLQA